MITIFHLGSNKIYPDKLERNKVNSSEKQTNFLDPNLSITNGFVTTEIYDKTGYGF